MALCRVIYSGISFKYGSIHTIISNQAKTSRQNAGRSDCQSEKSALFSFLFVCYTNRNRHPRRGVPTAETDTPGGVSPRGRDSVELPKRNPNRIRGVDYSQNGAYFITICTQNRQRILSKIVGIPVPGCPKAPCPELLSYGKTADKYIRQMDTFYDHLSVDKYVIMPDHIHFLISIHEQVGHPGRGVPTPRTSVVARFVGTFKRFCNKEYGQNIWQTRYYDHVIRSQQDYNEIWEYIDNNPRKWMMKKQGNGM